MRFYCAGLMLALVACAGGSEMNPVQSAPVALASPEPAVAAPEISKKKLAAPESAQWSAAPYAKPSLFSETDIQVGDAPSLSGMVVMPEGEGPFPAWVLVHGSGAHDADETVGPNKVFRDLAWGLASKGFVVLRYNKRTFEHPESLGSGFTLDHEVTNDAVSGLGLLRDHPAVDRDRVFILGHSLGAELVPRILKRAPWAAGGVVLAGRARPLGDLIVEQVTYLTGLDGVVDEQEQTMRRQVEEFRRTVESTKIKPTDSLTMLGITMPGSYVLDWSGNDGPQVAKSVPQPLLILQGERDLQVTTEDFDLWKKGLRTRQASTTFKLFPGLNHLFIRGEGPSTPNEYQKPGHVAVEVIDTINSWARRVTTTKG